MSEELYKKYRPRTLKAVVGQLDAVKALTGFLTTQTLPQALIFSGNSGCGKTTLARILKDKLNCGDNEFREINAADTRGIDTVREVNEQTRRKPLMGDVMVYLFDEAHQLMPAAQTAMLKMVEDPPPYVYYMFATTHPDKLIPTIRNRCTEIKLRSLKGAEIRQLLDKVCGKESLTVSDDVLQAIVEASDGSARKSLVILDKVAQLTDADRLEAVYAADSKTVAFDIVRAILYAKGKPSWASVSKIIDGLGDGEEWESLRYLVLACATKELLKSGSAKAANVIQAFQYNYYDSKKAGFVLSCYTAVNS